MKITKIFTLLIIITPILNYYSLILLEPMDWFAVLGIVFSLLFINKKIKINKPLLLFLFYFFIDTFLCCYTINSVDLNRVIIRLIRVVCLYYAFYCMPSLYFDKIYGEKIYSKLVMAVTSIVFFQTITYTITGVDINFLIPGVDLNYMGFTSDELLNKWHINAAVGFYRPCSVFVEPACHAQYVLPWLAMKLSDLKNNYNNKSVLKIAFVAMGSFLTTSSLAILGFIILLMTSVATEFHKSKKIFLSFFILIISLLIITITNSNIQKQLIYKAISFTTLGNCDEKMNSTTLRLLRGILIYNEFPLKDKLFGSGFGLLREFVESRRLILLGVEGDQNNLYMNSFSYVLCNLGLIGLALYLYFIYYIYRYSDNTHKNGLLVIILIYGITSSLFDSPQYFLVISFLLAQKTIPSFNIAKSKE